MAVKEPATVSSMVIDKQWLREQMAAMDARAEFVPDASMTVEKLHALMLAGGIRPEDNLFSRGILRERYPDNASDDAGEGE